LVDAVAAAAGVPTGGRRWTFGKVSFDESTLELRVDGEVVPLERKVLEVLRQFLFRAGEVLTKDELLEAVWPGRYLSETAVAKCVSRIRAVVGDSDQSVIKTVHGYGYRFVAPVVVEPARGLPPPHLGLSAGDHPPLRPGWSLVERLGSGGQGEAWLVRHDKSREQRVCKFALDSGTLVTLKREITLSRYLRDTLGERPDLMHVLDWNLEEPPYFLESEYAAGGNLQSWERSCGSLAAVDLGIRLEIAARVADALAAAHSVGVLHKDLKPANVLITGEGGGIPRLKLADFGSGMVLDPQRLDALGITRLGFSDSTLAIGAASPIYLAPEVMTGQPATVQGDVYSLGVMLYQLVIGDLKRPLAPGWELQIDDPLLIEDIAAAVAGEPSRRLGDVALLATRLRSLQDRRRARETQQAQTQRLEQERQAASERARRAELTVERLRGRRRWMLITVSTLVVGLALSFVLYVDARHARNEAREAAATSQAVADFLSKDLFAAVGQQPLHDLSVRELLDIASRTLDQRLESQPRAAAQIHASLGSAFWTIEAMNEAEQQLDQALDLFQRMAARGSADEVDTAARLVGVKFVLGKLPAVLPRYEAVLGQGRLHLGAHHPAVLRLRSNLAHARFALGHWREAAQDFRSLIDDARQAPEVDRALVAEAEQLLAHSRLRLGDFQDALDLLNSSIARLSAELGATHVSVAQAQGLRGLTFIELERFAEADADLATALAATRSWAVDDDNAQVLSMKFILAQLRLRQGRVAEATSMLEAVVETMSRGPWTDHSGEQRYWLALALAQGHRLQEAEAQMRKALAVTEGAFGRSYPFSQMARIELANIVREQGRVDEARETLSTVDTKAMAELGARHPLLAALRRAQGLLALRENRIDDAQRFLGEALNIYQARYGQRHAYSLRATSELASASR
jgi:serine/threonine protein kinase/DNA-binding winged helix-turn-helix (wHTH) protein